MALLIEVIRSIPLLASLLFFLIDFAIRVLILVNLFFSIVIYIRRNNIILLDLDVYIYVENQYTSTCISKYKFMTLALSISVYDLIQLHCMVLIDLWTPIFPFEKCRYVFGLIAWASCSRFFLFIALLLSILWGFPKMSTKYMLTLFWLYQKHWMVCFNLTTMTMEVYGVIDINN